MVTKQPDKTRQAILEAARWEIYRHGFQGASLDNILERTGVTKGALYHHFSNKLDLGYAVVDEIVRGWMIRQWITPLETIDDPIDGLQSVARQALAEAPDERIHHGCPVNNLVQEMSPIDEGFRLRLDGILQDWRGGIAKHLRRGQESGHVRTDLDPQAMAAFLVASLEGIAGTAKSARSREFAESMVNVFCQTIETLRPHTARREAAGVT